MATNDEKPNDPRDAKPAQPDAHVDPSASQVPQSPGEADPSLPSTNFVLPPGFENDVTGELVQRAKSGDTDALNELFTRYHQLMVEVARRRIGSRLRLKEDPDDLAQTTFREATRDFHNYEYRGEGSLVRWLMQILQNKIRGG